MLFSGSTFVVALFGMLLVPTTIMRSLAAGAIIVGVVSVAAALTLLPALLSLLGDRIDSARVPVPRPQPRPRRHERGPLLAEDRRRRPAPTGAQPRPQRRADAGGRGSDLRAAHRRQRRQHAAGQPAVEAGLPRAAARRSRCRAPTRCRIVVDGGNGAVAADLAKLQVRLAADPRFGRGTIQTAPAARRLGAVGGRPRRRRRRPRRRGGARPARSRPAPGCSPARAHACTSAARRRTTSDYFDAATNPTPVRDRVRARAQLHPAHRRLPLDRRRARLDPAQPALGRSRVRVAHPRLPGREGRRAARLPARPRRSTPGSRCSSSRCSSASRWTTRSS